MALLLAIGGTAPLNAQNHRHTQRTEVQGKAHGKDSDADKSSADNSAQARLDAAQARLDAAQKQFEEAQQQLFDEQQKAADADAEAVAYSDTSSVSDADAAPHGPDYDADDDETTQYNRYSPKKFSDPFSWFAYVCSNSFVGFLFTMFVILLVIFFLLLPFIIIAVIVRYIIRRHNDRVRLAEMAMEQGRPLADEQTSLGQKSPQYMWRKGVKNLSVGVGLVLFFWFLDARPLVGIGGLIACMGVGQMFMARYNFNFKRRNDSHSGFGNFTDSFDDAYSDDLHGTTWTNDPTANGGKKAENTEDKAANEAHKAAAGDKKEDE